MEFEISNNKFIINGEEVKIISGAIHYFRSTPDSWPDKLDKLKSMGCNTVETYVPWNIHEVHKGEFDFAFNKDLIMFLKLCEDRNLYIILRMCPYICAEHEWGGLPYWLLNDNVMIRSSDPKFIMHVDEFYKVMIPLIFEHLAPQGGRIIMMQVENEYGSYGNDKEYLEKLINIMQNYGVNVPLFTSDGLYNDTLNKGTIEGIFATANFGACLTEDIDFNYSKLKHNTMKNWPFMCMELWCGWFNHWDQDLSNENAEQLAENARNVSLVLDKILAIGNVNLYMFHGGTNFGFYNGANFSLENGLKPDTTSYDYGAPLDEAGNPYPKYYLLRETISQYNQIGNEYYEEVFTKYPDVKRSGYCSLIDVYKDISKEFINSYPLTMERLNNGYGYILYESDIFYKEEIEYIKLKECNDRAHVFIDDVERFKFYKCDFSTNEKIEVKPSGANIKILVENLGRVNYGTNMNEQHKGIKGGVIIDNTYHFGWKHYIINLEKEQLRKINFNDSAKEEIGFHKFDFIIEGVPTDTYINMTGWGKGSLVINNFNLGRFWDVGPQADLYLPKGLLKTGLNEIIIFETEGKSRPFISFSNARTWLYPKYEL